MTYFVVSLLAAAHQPAAAEVVGHEHSCPFSHQPAAAEVVGHDRAVGAGPAGPEAAGPIFGQLTHAKMPYELWWVVQLLL